MMSDRLRRLWKIGGTAAFGSFVFFMVFVLTLPFNRVRDYMVALADKNGYDVEIKSAGPALGVGIRLTDVTVSTRPADGGKPTRILVPFAKLRWSLLGALAGRKTYQVSANLFKGDVDVETTQSKSESSLQVAVTAIDLSEIPFVKAAINLPLSGSIDLQLDDKMPGLRASATKGTLTWTCRNCALGDGKAKLIIPGNPLLAEGLLLPKIRLGEFVGRVVMDKGVGRLQGVQSKSPDGELFLEGEIKLGDTLAASSLDLYVRFKLSDTLLKSSDKLRTIMQFAGSSGKRPDDFYGLRISGPLTRLGQPIWTKTSPFGAPASGPKPSAAKPSVAATPPPPPPAPPPTTEATVEAPPQPAAELLPPPPPPPPSEPAPTPPAPTPPAPTPPPPSPPVPTPPPPSPASPPPPAPPASAPHPPNEE
jgi:type II secretion system protein N